MRETRWQLSQSTGSLTIRALRTTDRGSYSCVVNSLAYPPITSSPAQLTVVGNCHRRYRQYIVCSRNRGFFSEIYHPDLCSFCTERFCNVV